MVSVIIPTHNRLKMLKRAVTSVLAQTYKNYEIIIVSDGSTDGTNNFLSNNKTPKVKYFISETSRGASAARNVGLKEVNGNYIAFLDDDDEWFPYHLEVLVKKIKSSKTEVGLVYGWIDYYKDNKIIDSKHPKLSGDIFKEMLDKQAITNSSVLMIKSCVLNHICGFDENLLRGNDGDFIRRISKKFHVDFVPKVLCKVHVGHEDRITLNSPKNLKNEINSYLKRLEKFKSDFECYTNQKANIFTKISISYLKLGELKKSLNFLRSAILLSKFNKASFLHIKKFSKELIIQIIRWT
tara:strand:- start:12743 stop:13630 length:888 start_codon:yes stop_codon:yes gene_type:complete